MRKNHFFGKYYKFIGKDGFTIAYIQSHANEGDMLQVIMNDGAHFIDDPSSFKINGQKVTISIYQSGLEIVGEIELGELMPLSHKVMGPFTYLPMECRHAIYSMRHSLKGQMVINGEAHSFDDGLGYIEGDSGTNFPEKYVWYNSVLNDVTVTMAIATIPLLGFINFIGLLCFIKTNDKEYRLCTYNFGKAKKITKEEIILKKGKLRFILTVPELSGHDLKAPVKGNMTRYIKENLNVPTSYKLMEGDKLILERKDEISSLEFIW